MLLKALYDYGLPLLKDIPLQKRTIHALIALDRDGHLRFDHLVPLTQPDQKGKERFGQERLMPRFPGENNGGKAYFLAADPIAVLGRDKVTGDPICADSKKGKNPTKAFKHFWSQIKDAHEATHDPRLAALLAFRSTYLIERDGKIVGDLPFLEVRQNKSGNPELVGKTGQNDLFPLKSATIGFSVDGNPLTMEDEADPLREYWFNRYLQEAFQDDSEEESGEIANNSQSMVCLVTGEIGKPIARSHKPKILGVPGLSSGGYIVSFAKEAPAFSSYGFEMGQNAPVSEQAAAAYALAVNTLLKDEDNHINIRPISICFWAKAVEQASGQFKSMLDKAYPEQVAEFLRQPFPGVDREVLKRARLYTVAFAGNKGRVVVQHWLDQSLDEASVNFKKWWGDLQMVSLYPATGSAKKKPIKKSGENQSHPSPLAILNLARATLRQSKGQSDGDLIADRVIQLYRAALEGTSLPITMLKPILDEFHSALVKNDEKNQTYPFSQSRFALIKLILIRNRKKEDEFMPTYELADTSDPAYNLGRLLAVFEELQGKYHNYEKKGPGVVERYYAVASSAPASAFPILCRLARHHLSKVRREDDKEANRIEERITEVMTKFQPISLGKPPTFPRVLTLEAQGRFALGFYQQKASRS